MLRIDMLRAIMSSVTIFKKIAVFALLLFGSMQLVAANDSSAKAADKLAELLQGYTTFSASFEQITLAENGREAEKVAGQLHLAKPNLFRWETELPFPQEIVSDGEFIWIHDPDLEQVTQRSAEAQQTSAPALILNGQIDELQKTYQIRLLSDSGSEQLFDLEPLSEQSNFSRIRLAFANNSISELMLEDSLGQRTSVVFSEQQLDHKQDQSLYLFRVPTEADLIVDIEG